MSIEFAPGTILIQVPYQEFITQSIQKKLDVQYYNEPLQNRYSVFATDNNIVFRTVLYSGTMPGNQSTFTTSQTTNDAWLSEFLSVYAPTSNKRIQSAITSTGSFPVTGSVSLSAPALIAGNSAASVTTVPQVDRILGQTVPQVSVATTLTSPGAAARGAFAFVNAYGSLRVSPESTNLFQETFDAATLDPIKWISSASGAGASVSTGGSSGTLAAGTVANSWVWLQSVPNFVSFGTTFEIYGSVSTFTGPTGSLRFFGVGTPQPVPTAANPIFDGVGFEMDLTGTLKAVVYNSGSQAYRSNALADPGTIPGRYGWHSRPDLILWYGATSEYPTASLSFTGSFFQARPVLNLIVNGAATLGSTAALRMQNLSINDSGKNSISLSDGTYAFRKAVIDASGSLAVGGLNLTGSTATATPILIAGVDSGSVVRGILVSPVSGAVVTTPFDGYKSTYSAAAVFSASAIPTDVFTITGAANKTIRVLRMSFCSTQTTAGQRDVSLVKRSTANLVGTSSTVTAVPHDSTSQPAQATVRSYTANPTLGSTVGIVRSKKVLVGSFISDPDEFISDFGNRPGQAVVLRGATQVLALNMNSTSSAGNSVACSVEWTEEP